MASQLYSRYVPPVPKTVPNPPNPQEINEENTEIASVPAQVKRKKRKLKHDNEDASNEDPSQRHQSILSKFQKSAKIAEATRQTKPETTDEPQEPDEQELHDLAPLPQPEQPPEPQYKPTFSALAKWLAEPIIVPSDTQESFSSLGLKGQLLKQLSKFGLEHAFAVQCGLIPFLLPRQPRQHYGDVCVSAATGSGKTLSYILPIIQSLEGCGLTKLRAVIVVPTRELVAQCRKTAEEFSVGTGLKIGVAVGNQALADEQRALVQKSSRYDPDQARQNHENFRAEVAAGLLDVGECLDREVDLLPGHVPYLESKVDILICTPGRLVEHLNSTTSFTLLDLQWLVIDEADRLLDQSFQEWAKVLTSHIHATSSSPMNSKRDQLVARYWGTRDEKPVTKVILSATMTRDLAKLSPLRLYRPKLLVIEDANTRPSAHATDNTEEDIFTIPHGLDEHAVPVGDGSEKPLYLLELLRARIPAMQLNIAAVVHSPDSSDDESTSIDTSDDSSARPRLSQNTVQHSGGPASTTTKVLIFTNNNENADRLKHVIGLLDPAVGNVTATLTKSSASSTGKKVLTAFKSGQTNILIASDRASRGLDVPDLTHIINYDIPRSVVSYVHRVGRTARAGRSGEAWTFFTATEGKWFWNTIGKGPQVRRGNKIVVRTKLNLSAIGEQTQRRYGDVLEQLKRAVEGDDGP